MTTTPQLIHVLLVEDSPHDAQLELLELKRAGFAPQWRRVASEAEFLAILDENLDVILADVAASRFGGMRALELARGRGSEVPIIILGATPGGETAVTALRRGAADFLCKDRLTRLGPAVRQALEQRQLQHELQQARQALRAGEDRFRELAETIREVFWTRDAANGDVIYVSPAYAQVWGRSCESLYRQPNSWFDAIHPQDRERVLKAANQRTTGVYEVEYRILRPDGTMRWIHDRASAERGPDGAIQRFIGVAEDVSQQKDLETKFYRSQKLEGAGRLAGGVAHDFNNMLTVILCNAQTILDRARLESEDADILKDTVRAGQVAARLTRQLLGFSRQQTLPPRIFEPNEVVGELIKLLRRILGERIDLKWEPARPSPRMEGDPGLLEQIVVNLAVNPRDAMPKGGELLIKNEIVVLTETDALNRPETRAGEFIRLTVQDTGCGIPPEILPRIFEPFFSTKGPDRGNGLGLATVFGIAQQYRGWVEVQSKLNCGTIFKVHLPVSSRAAEWDDLQRTLPLVLGGRESILLVEDELSLRWAARRILQRLGYTVFEAPSCAEALAVWKQQEGRIHLLLTDMTLSDAMSGRELARRLRKEKPELKVVFTSGYNLAELGPEFLSHDGDYFLLKPYEMHRLAETLRASLENSGATSQKCV